MGTCKLFLDIIQSYMDDKIPDPLRNHVYFEYPNYNSPICISTDDYYVSKMHSDLSEPVVLRIITLKNRNKDFYGAKEEYIINIFENDIKILKSSDDEIIFTESTDDKDLFFNISLEYNLILALEELKEIQKKFIELIKLKKHIQVRIFYTFGEQNNYGY